MSIAHIALDRGIEAGRAQTGVRAPENDTMFPKLMQELERELVRNGDCRAVRSDGAVHGADGWPSSSSAPARPGSVTETGRLRELGDALPATDPRAWTGETPSRAVLESRLAPPAPASAAPASQVDGVDSAIRSAAGTESVAPTETALRSGPFKLAPAAPDSVKESNPVRSDDGLSDARAGSAGPTEGQVATRSTIGPSATLIVGGTSHGAPAVVAVAVPRLDAREADELQARIDRELAEAGLPNYELIINGKAVEPTVRKGGMDGH